MCVKGNLSHMSAADSGKTASTYIVEAEMNEYDAFVVREQGTNATYQIVAYGDEDLRDRVADLPSGATVGLRLRRAGLRANAWEVTGAGSVSSADANA